MKIDTTALGLTGIGNQSFAGGIAFSQISCAGTSSGGASVPLIADGAFEYTLLADRVDDSNFGIQFPQQLFPVPSRVNIIANGPSGKSITVYLGSLYQLSDGSSSLDIDCGKIKTFMFAARNGFAPIVLAVNE